MIGRYSTQLSKLLELSRAEAARLKSAQVEPAHLLLGMLKLDDNEGLRLLKMQGADTDALYRNSEEWILNHVQTATVGKATVSRRAEKVLRTTMIMSMTSRSSEVGTNHLLLAMTKESENETCQILAQEHVSYTTTMQLIQGEQSNKTDNFTDGHGVSDDEMKSSWPDDEGIVNMSVPSEKKSKTPLLDNYGRDLTRLAAEGILDPIVGRKNEILRISQILSRRKKNNPILIGEPGVGKNAIVEGLAMRIVKRQVARILFGKRIISLDLAAVVAGTKYRGQFEERIRGIVREVQQNKNIILFIDEIHTIIGAGSAAGTMDAANMLKPALAQGGMQCIGATTLDEYRKSIEKDGALERRFQKVLVEPTSKAETLEILHNLRERYECHHNVRFTDEALQACVDLTDRYVTDRSFPDKAIDALDESGARVHIANLPENTRLEQLENELEQVGKLKSEAVANQNFAQAGEYRTQALALAAEIDNERKNWAKEIDKDQIIVDEAQVAEVVAQITGIPVQRMEGSEKQRLRQLQDNLQQCVVGQRDAIDRVARAIQRSRVGLKDPNKPIGTFMFLGPTGVGKTYLTKCLAEQVFGQKDALIRLDMSEFMEKHTVSRLMGAPPGYVGYDEGGQLTEKVRRHPYSIVLLDEIEKAHPDVFNVLLQVMDEGRLTDGNGTTIDFKNTIIIMTSNCGTRQLKEFGNGIGFGATSATIDNKSGRDVIQKALKKQFAPEFLNRLDEIVFFDHLSKEDIIKMVDLEMKPIIRRVADMGYTLVVDDKAKDFVAEKGYDMQYGARPLARAIQTHIEDAICELVMRESVTQGQTITATSDGKTILLNV